jgi:DNA-binding NarL/FixJ family response regulator
VVAAGDALLAPSVTRRVIADMARPRVRPELAAQVARLTDREAEVLRGMASGLSNAELADRMILGEATVKTHVSRVLMKLNLRDRVQAVAFAYESGLIQPGG